MSNFFFGIPLRSRRASRDWSRVCALLDATLNSALRQLNPDIQVVVACHELPKTHCGDDRLTFSEAKHARPRDPLEQMFDKRFKKIMLAEEVCRRGGGYLMLLDSDDLVSNQLADFVLQQNNKKGYLVDQGFIYDAQLRQLRRVCDFDRICGSSVIAYLSPADCDDRQFAWREYIGDTWHAEFRRISADLGRPLEPLPFPAAVYVTNNGENHSAEARGRRRNLRAKAMDARKLARERIRKDRPKVQATILEEFGLESLSGGVVRYAGHGRRPGAMSSDPGSRTKC
jgi:hypothetical protein